MTCARARAHLQYANFDWCMHAKGGVLTYLHVTRWTNGDVHVTCARACAHLQYANFDVHACKRRRAQLLARDQMDQW